MPRDPDPTDRRGARGPVAHTLWEVLLVLATIGVIAAGVAPTFAAPGGGRDDVSHTVEQVVALANRARTHALERAITVELVIDPSASRYWTYDRIGDELRLGESGPIAHPITVTLAAGTARPRFIFSPTGTARGDGIIVRGNAGHRWITVDPWAGSAHVAAR